MKPELVLTEEDKKRRFKKFLKKKEKDDHQSGQYSGASRDDDGEQEPDLPPLEPIQTKFCSFLTPSFRQNLHLLFNRQNTVCYSPSGHDTPDQWVSQASQSQERAALMVDAGGAQVEGRKL